MADGNSQWEVARMLGVSQWCISKMLRRYRETGRPHQRKHGGSMKIFTPREDRQLLWMVRMNHLISALRLRMQIVRRFGRRMSVWTIRRRLLATRYWSLRPARCPRLTLEHKRRHCEWERRHIVWDLRQWRHCIFSDESRFSLYHSEGRLRVRCRQGERLIDACIQPNDGNRGPSVMVWCAIHHRGRSEVVVVDGAMNRHRYIQILRNQMLPWATGVFGQDNAPPPLQHVTRQPFWTNRMLRSWTGQLRVQTWTQLSMFGIKCQSGSEAWMTRTSSVAELNNAVHQAWTAVRPGRVRTLVESMPRRVRAFLAARGGHTRY